jgi:cell division septal protein FtsQ
MSRRLIVILAGVLVVAVAVYWFGFRQKSVEADVQVPQLAAAIGEGEEAVGVAGHGAVVRWLPPPEDPPLPRLPLDEVPKGGKVRGTALEQVRVLAAVPAQLRPYVESSYFGESGVDVTLTTGIELRFGDASQAARKWRAVAAVLADPSVTSPSYVDVHAPSRPAYEESGSELPPAP